ncbi:MAG: hypothetical protein HY892_07790 [Deltaproteobacteria bacterium]|nr:hypothetical protein [Deltaproteobacteria bacterium]
MKKITGLPTGARLSVLLAVFFGLATCAASFDSLRLPEQLVERGVVPQGVSIESLRRGRALALAECKECHRFRLPDEYPPGAWPGIVRDMGAQASLNDGQIGDLEAYFVSASKAARLPPR